MRGRGKVGGFTLVELMIVIAIIAILASIAIPQYLKYQRKAKVNTYALPIARACLMDYVAWCTENPGQTPQTSNLRNCYDGNNTSDQTFTTAGGDVTLTIGTLQQCGDDGSPGSQSITATLSTAPDYTANCTVVNNSTRCTIQ